VEALLLSFVAVLAAYSGYAAAKWGTESSLTLAKASAERTRANRADTEAIVTRTLDSASFNAWFTAFTAGNADAQRLAENRMRPGYRTAFDAWLATDPLTNPSAPGTPFAMPQYLVAEAAEAARLETVANARSDAAGVANERSDKYMLAVVLFASALFFAGMSTKLHALRQQEVLLALGIVIFVGAAVFVATFPVMFVT